MADDCEGRAGQNKHLLMVSSKLILESVCAKNAQVHSDRNVATECPSVIVIMSQH